MAFKFTDNNFQQEAIDSEVPVLIDFYADWCGPCKMMAPIVEELAKEYEGKVKIGKLDIDQSMKVAQDYKVVSIPTLLFMKGGTVVDKVVGAVSKGDLSSKINKYF